MYICVCVYIVSTLDHNHHGVLIRGHSPNSENLILKRYLPIKQPRGLLLQGRHYIMSYLPS